MLDGSCIVLCTHSVFVSIDRTVDVSSGVSEVVEVILEVTDIHVYCIAGFC